MDQQAFDLLIKHIDGIKVDLKADIADLKVDIKKVEADMEEQKRFKWKFSGGMVVFTLIFNLILAWVQRGSGKT